MSVLWSRQEEGGPALSFDCPEENAGVMRRG